MLQETGVLMHMQHPCKAGIKNTLIKSGLYITLNSEKIPFLSLEASVGCRDLILETKMRQKKKQQKPLKISFVWFLSQFFWTFVACICFCIPDQNMPCRVFTPSDCFTSYKETNMMNSFQLEKKSRKRDHVDDASLFHNVFVDTKLSQLPHGVRRN